MKLQNKSLKDDYTAYFPWGERLFLCLAVLLAYASVWPNGFVFDDINLIVKNELLKHWSTLPQLLTLAKVDGAVIVGFCRPIQMLAYFLMYQLFGLSAVAFHALNISLHAVNVCLMHHFGIRAGLKKGVAFSAALLWALHPLHTVDVAYVASTAELLWMTFCFLGLIVLLPDFSPRRIGKAMIFFILALGCKESAVVFSALAAITFFLVSKDRTKAAAYFGTWPLWLLSAIYVSVWAWYLHESGYSMDKSGDPLWFQNYTSNFTNRVFTSLATLPVYAGLMIWPAGLHIERIFPSFLTLFLWQPATGALIVGAGAAQVFWGGAKRGLALSFGFLWFVAALSPYTGIVLPIDGIFSEGWMYVPTMGLFLGVVQTVSGFFKNRENAAPMFVLGLALLLGSMTFQQSKIWRNPETLYQNILQNGGEVVRLAPYLGLFYMEQGEFDKAIRQLQYTVENPAGSTRILQAETHLRLAMAWLHIPPDKNEETFTLDIHAMDPHHIPEAIAELGKALRDNPDFYWAHAAMAVLYRYQGNNQMADFHDRKVKAILQSHK